MLEPRTVEIEDEPVVAKNREENNLGGATPLENIDTSASQKNSLVKVKTPPPPYSQRLQNYQQEV
ncbi:hypothetical protein EPI10_006740 [Gossypium australe]|uniref:Uncharacterized protein n=1 Tax=Gossypium australe TaxID=47621 RepID=A0A5B6WTF7_9ROSI|nr:hypothetical protein EPI10_006740 [Gossypium australe]